MPEQELKQCPTCKEWKPVPDYKARAKNRTCKACEAAYRRKRYAERADVRMYHRAKAMEHHSRYNLDFEVAKRVLSGPQCVYCLAPNDGSTEMGIDHDLPIGRGGTNDEANLVLCCSVCNQGKRSMTGDEYRAWLAAVTRRLTAAA